MSVSLLAELDRHGIHLVVRDGRLRARPKRRLTPEIRELIAEQRDALIEALGARSAYRPLDDDDAAFFAAKHGPLEIDRRLARIEQRARSDVATVLDIVVLDDWRRIRDAIKR